jgi:hypothetical protein
MTGLDNLSDFAGQVFADARKFRKVTPGRQQALDALRQTLDDARGPAIGAHPKLIFTLDFKKFSGLIEHGRDFRILHRHDQPPCWPLAYGVSNCSDLMQIRGPAALQMLAVETSLTCLNESGARSVLLESS